MSARTYPKDAHGNTIFPAHTASHRVVPRSLVLQLHRRRVRGLPELFTRQKTAGATLATWKWSDWHQQHGHLWQQRPGKPTRCVICRQPVLPWHRRWRNRVRIRRAIIRSAMWWPR